MDIFLYMICAVTMGVGAILLVSGELSFISGLNKSGRYILAFFLSFGVLGFSVKTVAIGLLQQNTVLSNAVKISKESQTYEKADNIPPRGLTYKNRGKVWQALHNPFSDLDQEKVALGEKLFFDERLSANGKVSCASCHVLSHGGDDPNRFSLGVDGQKGGRNAPSVINAAFMKKLFWDARATSLEDQAAGPLTNPVEMALRDKEEVVKIVGNIPTYQKRFQHIYSSPLTFDQIADVIATYERTLLSINSAYDRFIAGDQHALNPTQIKGMMLFDEIGCRNCHMDPTFSVAGIENKSPLMPFPVFKQSPFLSKHDLLQDRGKGQKGIWRVPSLRNIAHTAPYFHNGSVNTLTEAVKVMASAQLGLEITDTDDNAFTLAYEDTGARLTRQRRSISTQEIEQIVAFLNGLSGTLPKVSTQVAQK